MPIKKTKPGRKRGGKRTKQWDPFFNRKKIEHQPVRQEQDTEEEESKD